MQLIKYILGFLLKFPNSDTEHLPITKGEFYFVKQKLLKKYGKKICYDKQIIEKICNTCRGLGEVGYRLCLHCDNGVWKRIWVKLAVVKLGNNEFHYPKNKFSISEPKFKARKLIEGYINHDKSKKWSINLSLYALLLFFDRKLLRKMISFHLRGFRFYNKLSSFIFRIKCRFSKDQEIPF